MRVWYHMGESQDRVNARLRGEEPSPMHLYPETDEIVKSFQTPENAEGWQCFGLDAEFDSIEEAEREWLKNEDKFVSRLLECRRAYER